MKNKPRCPHCKGQIEMKLNNMNPENESKVVLQSHIPGFRCSELECKEVHPNPNYKNRITARCSRCGQFAKNNIGPCPWCNYLNTLQLVNEDWLDRIGVPKP